MSAAARFGSTFAITSLAWFVFALDRLVVITALPVISTDLGADLAGTEWTITAYTLSFAVLLLTGAALGDRFGRRRMFMVGVAVFTVASAAAALAPTVGALVAARAVQGAGGATFTPLTMTMLSAATPPGRRGAVLGAWGGIGGLGAALGPLVGGGLTEWFGWQWIFWLNVPLGMVALTAARRGLVESHGPDRSLDLPGVGWGSVGVFGVVWAVIQAGAEGWMRPAVLVALGVGALGLTLFVAVELRAATPMLPMRMFRSRAFAAANLTAFLMYAAVFGALFLVSQLLQTGLGASPWEAGLRTLPMVVMPVLFVPVGGVLGDRLGARPLMIFGVALEVVALGWLAAVTAAGVPYVILLPALMMMGAGSALFFAPVAATVLGAVAPPEHGKASGAAMAVRELAVVVGVAVLSTVVATHGDTGSGDGFIAGVVPAFWLATALAAVALPAALAVPRTRAATMPPAPGSRCDRVVAAAG